ncbi:MAG: S41 family peptidase [Acidimicrobiia bacterium]
MTNRRILSAILAMGLVVSACLPATDASSLTTTTESPRLEPDAPDPTTTGRAVEEIDCGSAPQEVEIVCEAYDLIKTRYVDQIDDETLAEAAIQGIELLALGPASGGLVCVVPADEFESVCESAADFSGTSAEAAEAIVNGLALNALDPNSAYFDEAAVALLEQEQGGEIEGIGALVSPEDRTIEDDNKQCNVVSDTCQILIVSTIEGAPAEGAGLRRDDSIVGVDGESIIGWTVDEVTSRVRGPAGSEVTLSVERDGEVFEVTITRAAVEIPVIETETFGDVGYVRLRVFSQNADEQFETAIVDQLAGGVATLVIDLRDNPGGLLTTAIDVTSVFLDEGDVVVTKSPDETTPYRVSGASIVPDDIDVVFIVNKGSASASEVVSAVLQEEGLITVVGENTFGKNTVQQRFPLSNGGALKLTIARWLTPGGLDFGGVGVTPNVKMIVDQTDPEELVAAVLAATAAVTQ